MKKKKLRQQRKIKRRWILWWIHPHGMSSEAMGNLMIINHQSTYSSTSSNSLHSRSLSPRLSLQDRLCRCSENRNPLIRRWRSATLIYTTCTRCLWTQSSKSIKPALATCHQLKRRKSSNISKANFHHWRSRLRPCSAGTSRRQTYWSRWLRGCRSWRAEIAVWIERLS